MAATCHWPAGTKASAAVAAAPITVKPIRSRTRAPPRSAIAPSTGATSAISALATPFVTPSRKVLSVTGMPRFQCCLKKTGKKPAMTVVANAEFAQS